MSLLANEFNVRCVLQGQVSLVACNSGSYERLQKSRDSLKACFQNVIISFTEMKRKRKKVGS